MDGNRSNVNPTDTGEWGRLTPEQKVVIETSDISSLITNFS
jgi:hypothetical protein